MDLHVFPRNNDLGPQMPTFRERLNGMMPAPAEQTSAAPALDTAPRSVTPHMLNNEEMEEAENLKKKNERIGCAMIAAIAVAIMLWQMWSSIMDAGL